MTLLFRRLKENTFFVLVAMSYILLLVLKPDIGIQSIKNSGYYIKEMLFIMPVIFVLTALLDTWVPKRTIIKYLGGGSGLRGILLSFALGAVSAGPIYAAFPVCVMLHKKGATIKNTIIILSSWAVIKIPMLLNETKFLGAKFMFIRWILTVTAILIFSWIASYIVRDEDIPEHGDKAGIGLYINGDACIGCSLCVKEYAEVFGMKNKKAYIKEYDFEPDRTKLRDAVNSCPMNAIEFK